MKPAYLIGMGVFWTVVVMLGVAGLVSYEQNKEYEAQAENIRVIDTQVVMDAVTQGATVWDETLVAQHTTTDDCWIIVNGGVYDVTEYVPFHPGGEQAILTHCGEEATQAFTTKGGIGSDHTKQAYTLLGQYRVAALGDALPVSNTDVSNTASAVVKPPAPSTPPPTPPPDPSQTTYTMALVAQHSSVSDCWLVINNKIYNVTNYIPFHPGGTNTIRPWCGKESTQAFTTRGGNGRHSRSAWSQLERYYFATLGAAAPAGTTPAGTTPTTGAISPTSAAATSYEAAIQDEYPEAVMTDINVEDDGRAEVKFIYEGDTYEAKLDASYNILEARRS